MARRKWGTSKRAFLLKRALGISAASIAFALSAIQTMAADGAPLPKDGQVSQEKVSIEKQEVAKCAAEKDGIKRLECYDVISVKLGVDSPKTDTSSASKWMITKKTSPVDDSINVTAMLDAEGSISGWPGKTETPTLVIRCKEKRTEAYLITGMHPDVERGHDGASVTIRFDKEKAERKSLGKSTDGEALFFGKGVEFIQKALKHSSMLFEFTPYNSSPTRTTFDLSGIDDAVKPVKEACGWK